MPRTFGCTIFLGLAVLMLPGGRALSQEKKKDKAPEPPLILQVIPPFASPGKAVKVLLRGKGLDQTKEVKALGKECKVLRKGKAGVPQGVSPNLVGDTEVEIEIPASSGEKLPLVVKGEGGESKPFDLPVYNSVLEEKEPNGSFRQGQELKAPVRLYGKAQSAQDVDVFQVVGPPGKVIKVHIQAARLGSALDPVLTVYDDKGTLLLFADDIKEGRDAALEIPMPKSGRLQLVIQDAFDQGGDLYYYLLEIN